MATKDRATLLDDLLVSYPDNAAGLITPPILRSQQTDIIESYLNLIDEGIGLISISSSQDWIDNTVDLGGGRRQMGLNASYRLLNPVTRSFSLVCNGVNAIRSENFIIGVDTYSGSSNESYESTTTNDGLLLRNMQSVSLSAPLLGFTGSLGIFLSNSTCICKGGGAFEGNIFFAENYQFGIESNGLTSGLLFTGSGFTISMSNCTAFPDKTVTFDILALGTSTWQNIRISDMEWNTGLNNVCISGEALGANLLAGGAGFVSHNNFGIATDPLTGVSPHDDPWIFTGNIGNEPDSGASIGVSVDNNVTETVIGVGSGDDGNPIQVNVNALAVDYISERFTAATDGTITHDGVNPVLAGVSFIGQASGAAGNNILYTFYVAVNGVIVPGSRGPISLDSADPGVFATQALVGLVTGDTIALFIENNTNTNNITITDFSLVIK